MKKIILISLIVIIVIGTFSYGFFSGHYKIFPFEELKILKENFEHDSKETNVQEFFIKQDVKKLITIENEKDVLEKRQDVIDYIWKKDNHLIFSKMPTDIQKNIIDSKFEGFSNIKRIDQLKMIMKFGIESNAYLLLPEIENNKVIIYHQGHSGDFSQSEKTIQFFLDKGFSILIFSMPLVEPNNKPIVETEFGSIELRSHEFLKFLESENFSTLSLFTEPVIVGINYLENNFEYSSYYMVGISGGGWTTVLVSAIDDRISKSFSVAGSVPIYLRTIPNNLGDYEQTIPDFYKIANYLDLYIMSSHGENRQFIQIFNKYDPCCFSGDVYKTYDSEIKEVVNKLDNGMFEVFLDENKEHTISQESLEYIVNAMENY